MTVHIVESVKLGEGEMLSQSLRLAGVDSTFRLVRDQKAFQHALRDIRDAPPSRPYVGLHVSSHGDRTGISLMSGERVTWYELCQLLLPINRASASSLVVTMSTCHGLFGTGMALELHDAPFRAIVGSVSEVTFSDAAVAFIVFYHQLTRGAQLDQAVDAMKIASGEDRFGIVDGEATRQGLLEHLKANGIMDFDR